LDLTSSVAIFFCVEVIPSFGIDVSLTDRLGFRVGAFLRACLTPCRGLLLPLRVVPAALVASVIYAPMGLRVDGGGYFAWYMLVLALFSSVTALTTYCTGLLCPSIGAAALLSAVVTLWNFVFGCSCSPGRSPVCGLSREGDVWTWPALLGVA
jgi:hypothetical protein